MAGYSGPDIVITSAYEPILIGVTVHWWRRCPRR